MLRSAIREGGGALSVLEVLVVDDDDENIIQLKELLPTEISTLKMSWEYCNNFDNALIMLRQRRFDILISDIYRGREKAQKTIAIGDARARDLVDEIRSCRFCPIVLFTDGQVPEELTERPFVWSADKGASNFHDTLITRIQDAISTGLPEIARRLHDELDKYAGSYVWRFLADRWNDMRRSGVNTNALERIIRRRAAVHFGRVDGVGDEVVARATVEPVDYYIYPPISKHLRLGEIIRRRGTVDFRVVLTPHCFLTVQPGEEQPRASHVLTAHTLPAAELVQQLNWPQRADKILDQRRKVTSFPALGIGQPQGRYCFLPRFLDIPDIYCDLMRLESLAIQTVRDEFDRIAVLDWPFAEALQSTMVKLYGAVGVPVLVPDSVQHVGPN